MKKTQSKNNRVILFCGKGGVGKTTLAAITIKTLQEKTGKKILAIDADPAFGLGLTLGIEPGKTIDDILNQTTKTPAIRGKEALFARLDYELTSALAEDGSIAFIALGRPESEGCFCAVNRVLKEVLAGFTAGFDIVVIDAEAGVEQINRRVFDTATHLFIITDPTRKGINVAKTILGLAGKCIGFNHAGIIVNRCAPGLFKAGDIPQGFHSNTFIPEDPEIRKFDQNGGDSALLLSTKAGLTMKDYLLRTGLTAP